MRAVFEERPRVPAKCDLARPNLAPDPRPPMLLVKLPLTIRARARWRDVERTPQRLEVARLP